MATYTQKLGLTKPDGPEYVNVDDLNNNFNILDKAAGVRFVNANQIPPDTDLYDGLIVNERNNGKTWIASKNAGGTFDRAWIRYPYYIYTTSQVINPWGTGEARSLVQNWSSGVNSSAADVPGGSLSIPLQGVYSLAIYSNWGTVDNPGAGRLDITYQVNGGNAPFTFSIQPPASNFPTVTVFPPMQYKQGDKLIPRMYNGTGGTCRNVYCHCVLALQQPTGINNN